MVLTPKFKTYSQHLGQTPSWPNLFLHCLYVGKLWSLPPLNTRYSWLCLKVSLKFWHVGKGSFVQRRIGTAWCTFHLGQCGQSRGNKIVVSLRVQKGLQGFDRAETSSSMCFVHVDGMLSTISSPLITFIYSCSFS